MSAYLELLAERFSIDEYTVRQIPFKYVGMIYNGRFRDENYRLLLSRVGISDFRIKHVGIYCLGFRRETFAVIYGYNILQANNAGISQASLLIGTYFINGNHWTLLVLDLHAETVLFIDPFGHNESEIAKVFAEQFGLFAKTWNQETDFHPFPETYTPVTKPHKLQEDGSSCGIHTLTMCKKLLKGSPIIEYDVAAEGAVIAADLLANTKDLKVSCSKCGLSIAGQGRSFYECKGTCMPPRVFHYPNCLTASEKQISGLAFKCQICDPTRLESFCQLCSRRPVNSKDILYCARGCLMFIHPACLPKGMPTWRCGVCHV